MKQVLEEAGVQCVFVKIGEVKGCTGCGKCWKKRRCVIEDEVNLCADAMQDSDGLILGFESYYGRCEEDVMRFVKRLFHSASDVLDHKLFSCVIEGRRTESAFFEAGQYMMESVKYWINEYHIDGFRFDLMGVHDIETMNQIASMVHSIDPTMLVYGEGWSAGSCAYPQEKLAMKAHMKQVPEVAAFSDDLRDALRGPWDGDDKAAFLGGLPGFEESIKFGIVGAIEHPQVNYKKVNYSK